MCLFGALIQTALALFTINPSLERLNVTGMLYALSW